MPDRALVAVEERTPAPVTEKPPVDKTRIGLKDFLVIALQAGLVLWAAVTFRLELERGMVALGVLVFGGFLVHAWLPVRRRALFFVLLTMAALGWLLRADALWVAGLGFAILGICHLPVAWGVRAALVGAAAAGLATIMAGAVGAPWGDAVIPVLAAMFMFRVLLYLYDLKTDKTPASLWQRIAYFFLLPNVSFPLFPLVHYKTFLRGYYDAPAAQIYQKGVYWMLRGVVHLILYRMIYHALPLTETNLTGILGVAAYFVMLYGFLLRVSGLFHFTVGILCLFGFNLPPTNHHYYLASGFNDLWRRANIYWRDFMMTVVFNPVLMMLRRFGMGTRLFIATVVVFVVTWFLHAYQWFWLRGVFPVTGPDIAFWAVLGGAVLYNTLRESKKGRQRRLGRPAWSWRAALGLTLRVMATFTAMALLWALWNGGSFRDWGYRLLLARESDALGWAVFAAALAAVVAGGIAAQWLQSRGRGLDFVEKLAWQRAPITVTVVALSLVVLGTPAVHKAIGGPVEVAIRKAQSNKLNKIDRERQERGYYETLSRATAFGVAPDRTREERPDDWVGFRDSPAARPRTDALGWEIVPGVVTDFKGVSFRANRWGMRDREVEQAKPPGTYRIALVGGSYEMGSAVRDDETYDNYLEDRLNAELAGAGYERYEVLNFGVGGYGLPQVVRVVEGRTPAFQPDVVIYVVYPGEETRTVASLREVLGLGLDPAANNETIARVLAEAGGHAGLPMDEFQRRLHPYREELVRSSYRRLAEAARRQGAAPVFVFMSKTNETFRRIELDALDRYARDAGAETVRILDAFEGHRLAELRVAEWDNHPNASGHRLIADAWFRAMTRDPETFRLPARAASAAGRP